MNRLLEIHQALNNSPERVRLVRASSLNFSIGIFVKNYGELNALLDYMTSNANASELWALRRRYRLEAGHQELLRFLHNFTASAQSLVDHTRNLHKEMYSADGQFNDYQVEVNRRFIDDGLSGFI